MPQTHPTNTTPTLYFGYGSNLWKSQMSHRCPTSTYIGIARLKGYRWMINERGYANIVEHNHDFDSADKKKEKHGFKNEVWGLTHTLHPRDETRLDRNEGVPVAYTKEVFSVDFFPTSKDGNDTLDTHQKPEKKKMLVYISRTLTAPAKPKREYIYRMNMGIRDALAEGVPRGYVEGVMREFIPEEGGDVGVGEGD